MIESLRGVFKRDRDSPNSGQTVLGDDTETTIWDVGTLGGSKAYRLHSALLDVTLGSHSNITIRLKADVNGSLETIDSNTYSGGTITNLLSDIDPDRITSRRVVITAEGSAASPASDGTVDHSIEFTSAASR